MRAFLSFLLKGILGPVIGSVLIYALIFWYSTGKNPANIKNIKTMISNATNAGETLKKVYSANHNIADSINDDALLDVNGNTNEAAVINEAISAPVSSDYTNEIRQLKVKLARQQVQLDRVENQNRILILQFKERFKNTKIKTQ